MKYIMADISKPAEDFPDSDSKLALKDPMGEVLLVTFKVRMVSLTATGLLQS